MGASSKKHKRLEHHSRSAPNFAALQAEKEAWTSSTPPLPPPAVPILIRRPTKFTAGVPSEPGSEDEDGSIYSASSFEREYLSRPASINSDSASEDEDERPRESETNITPKSASLRPGLPRTISTPPTRPLYSHTSRSQSYVGPSAFAPPFYNRPPTPLPPSPSLTSLFRPRPFSALHSRQGTPDSSDTEATANLSATPHHTSSTPGAGSTTAYSSNTTLSAAAVAQSALNATTVPRASPKVPTYEYYGFVLYLGSSVAFFLYLLWSYLPTPFLHHLGIYYYPDRWWSLAVPAWLVVLLIYIYVALASWNTGVLTLALGRLECLVDEKGRVAIVDRNGRIVREDRIKRGLEGKKGRQAHSAATAGHGSSRNKQGKVRDAGYGRQGIGMKLGKGEEPRHLDWRALWNEGTDAVMDVPIGGVCQVLYGEDRHQDAELDGNEDG